MNNLLATFIIMHFKAPVMHRSAHRHLSLISIAGASDGVSPTKSTKKRAEVIAMVDTVKL